MSYKSSDIGEMLYLDFCDIIGKEPLDDYHWDEEYSSISNVIISSQEYKTKIKIKSLKRKYRIKKYQILLMNDSWVLIEKNALSKVL